jgi:TM2 domain-containing membrane protein YozV
MGLFLMDKSIKAVLLSAFLFPGAGHFYLKKMISGFVLAAAASASVYYLISVAIEKTMLIVDKIQNGEVQLDVVTITELVAAQTSVAEVRAQNIATAVLVISWVVGMLDSYRVGVVKKDNKDNEV